MHFTFKLFPDRKGDAAEEATSTARKQRRAGRSILFCSMGYGIRNPILLGEIMYVRMYIMVDYMNTYIHTYIHTWWTIRGSLDSLCYYDCSGQVSLLQGSVS